MKNIILATFSLILILGCSGEKTYEELLEEDKQELRESLDSYKVTTYKFGKIVVRASASEDTTSAEFLSVKSDIDRIYSKIVQFNNAKDAESLSLMDYVSLYQDYKKMEDFTMHTDEDTFPTLIEAFSKTYGSPNNKRKVHYTGEEKAYIQNIEHSVLSAIVVLSRDLGKEVSLYECSKTNPELLPDSEVKTLLQYFRGFLFFEKGLYYMSEEEITSNINWLNENQDKDLPLTRAMFQWGGLNNQQTHIGFHSLNHLFRGFDRLMMERDIDKERALEDFEFFLKDAQEIGLDNEVIWAIETYLYLQKEEPEKAVASLAKLKTSSLLTSTEIERIDESIEYLNNRESGKVLNGVYDKYFLSKIVTKYMLSVLSKVDWEKVMREQNVPHTEEIFRTITFFKNFTENLNKYASMENLKETGKDIQEKGEDIWNQAKTLVE
ncbi:hypothetical protein V6R21_23385 [Limibacter armeniacum]|uniref:hypothetical protein n=1 Tax=Limibacter armeniacum TaxID=466084 RepID=UPI002FE590AB